MILSLHGNTKHDFPKCYSILSILHVLRYKIFVLEIHISSNSLANLVLYLHPKILALFFCVFILLFKPVCNFIRLFMLTKWKLNIKEDYNIIICLDFLIYWVSDL